MAVFRLLDCSTKHITLDDARMMDDEPAGSAPFPCLGVLNHGYLLWVPGLAEFEEQAQSARESGFSDAFVALLKYASSLGVERVQLDSDGDELDGLPSFDW
jgi:hypothetical protein